MTMFVVAICCSDDESTQSINLHVQETSSYDEAEQ